MLLNTFFIFLSNKYIFFDDFGYSYFSGTNRLQTIGEGLTSYSYTYDNNGNMVSDQLNRTGSIKYDHRNLMTEIRVIKTETNPDPFGTPTIDVLYLTNYRYDEDCQSQFSETAKAVSPTGNRVRKFRYKYTGSTPDPVFDTGGDNPSWTLQSDEYYVRDISGKEIAIYSGSSLTQWNIWGLDNVGKINADTTRNYYLKDHLGSIRVVLNSTNTVISAQDYDAWGYQLENRSYNGSAMKYDFNSKERDDETNYDYFGARYYDSRIANWTSVDPLFEKHIQWSPYNYVLRNTLKLIDPDGMQVDITFYNSNKSMTNDLVNGLNFLTGWNLSINSNGTLQTDITKINGGSKTARDWLIKAMDGSKGKTIVWGSEDYNSAYLGNNEINLNPKLWAALNTAWEEGNFNNIGTKESFGIAIIFIHEMLHELTGLSDCSEKWDDNGNPCGGPIVDIENTIRLELGIAMGMRMSHDEYPLPDEYTYIALSRGAFNAIAFGRQPSAADQDNKFIKYKTIYGKH